MAVYTPTSGSEALEHKLDLLFFSNEFPSEPLPSLLRRLHNYSKDRSHPILAIFLSEVTRALRQEVSLLPTDLSRLVPDFESVLPLAEDSELRKGPLNGSIDGVLLCVLQLATYIGHCESTGGLHESSESHGLLTGLGIGLLAAAAVSVSSTLNDLVGAGVQVIRAAFRMGVHVRNVSQNLDVEASLSDSWAYVVYGLSPEDAQKSLDDVHSRMAIPTTGRVFISAVSETSVTLSGPPTRLQALFRTSGIFRGRKFAQLPVYGGLCHAPHIYGEDDVQQVLQSITTPHPLSCPSPQAEGPKHALPVLSTRTGKSLTSSSSNTDEVIEQIVRELLTKHIAWDNVIRSVTDRATDADVRDIRVMAFGTSLPLQQLSASLTSASITPPSVETVDLFSWMSAADPDAKLRPRGSMQSKIAIVGMSCRMPGGATDTDKFWDLLESGLDVHRKIPADRFNVDTHHDITGKRMNTSQTAYGCFIDEPGLFDAPFFNMSPREAEQTDPMQRLALVTAYEALERAGYVANRTPSTHLNRIGTWYGQASDDYREVNTAQEISTYFIPGGCRAFGPGRINFFFKFAGPSFNCDTACSSSLATIQAACTALWAGDVDTVVAGGLNVLTNSDAFAGLCNGYFLTKTPNACKTWDATADGYCRADGVGSIVMKRLEDAEADNDNILGVILAAATNHSANAVSITHPHAGHQADLYKKVMARAGVDPLDVSYVEFHGTGTQAGDAEEMKSITSVFAPIKGRRRTSKQPLHIGAVKANVGHGEAAAGITALLKVLLMLQNSAIPPHVGIKGEINPGFPKDMEERNMHIPLKTTSWLRNAERKRIAVINNFSAAGGNTTIALEEAPARPRKGAQDPRPSHVLTVSAKTHISLKGNIQRLVDYLDKKGGDLHLADLAYTLTARRHHHNHRLAIHAADIEGFRKQLAPYLEDGAQLPKPIPHRGAPSVAMVFTGQGAADKSMNLQLYHQSPLFREQIHRLDRLSQRHGFPSFISAVDGTFEKDHAFSPVITQLSHLCIQIALVKYWETLGVKPDVVVGHSLGEYAALCAAGVLSASDAIFLVGLRASMLEAKCTVRSHRMMAVKGPRADVEAVAEAAGLSYDLACINGPQEIVLSGTAEQMEALMAPLQARGYRCIVLDVAFAFHSAQTDPILADFERTASQGVVFSPPKVPVISPLLGRVIFDGKSFNAEYLRRSTRETVDFLTGMESALAMSIVDKDTLWVEIGPHPVCCNFVKAAMPADQKALAVGSFRRGEDNWTTLAQSLGKLHCAGLSISWADFHRPFESSLRLLDLPTYSWNDKTYWIQYNGDWALTKGNTFYDAEKGVGKDAGNSSAPLPVSTLSTSLVQRIVEQELQGTSGKVVMQSDLMQPAFLAAAYGHEINGCGVVTSSIHADIAFTLGKYLHQQLKPGVEVPGMNITDLVVVKGLVAKSKDTKSPQWIRVTATVADIDAPAPAVDLVWHNVSSSDGQPQDEPFASSRLFYGDANEWLSSWSPLTHLVQGRIEALDGLASQGAANRLSHTMAYSLFARSLVTYADKYRGMQSVVMSDFEAYANVTLKQSPGGDIYTVPPHFIDSVAHLAGFVMNVSDGSDTAKTFCVTPGWRSMRFARPLLAGQQYFSYVKMIPTVEDPSVYLGDVYILQNGEIVGLVGGIQFRRYPRLLLNRFFSPPDSDTAKSYAAATNAKPPAASAPAKPLQQAKAPLPPHPDSSHRSATEKTEKKAEEKTEQKTEEKAKEKTKEAVVDAPVQAKAANSDSVASKALLLIAKESGLSVSDLQDGTGFADIGVDSLMSLVIAEKFREGLGITVAGSLFLEYPTIGSLRLWLEEYYG